MIQAQHFRLGNLVHYSVNNEPPHIGKITGLYVTQEEEKKVIIDYHYPAAFGNPITLTPDILEKCGFVYRSEHRGEGTIMDLNNKDWKLGASMAMGREYEKNGGGWKYLGAPCCQPLFYVHQLQNIFHALTGSELTLTL